MSSWICAICSASSSDATLSNWTLMKPIRPSLLRAPSFCAYGSPTLTTPGTPLAASVAAATASRPSAGHPLVVGEHDLGRVAGTRGTAPRAGRRRLRLGARNGRVVDELAAERRLVPSTATTMTSQAPNVRQGCSAQARTSRASPRSRRCWWFACMVRSFGGWVGGEGVKPPGLRGISVVSSASPSSCRGGQEADDDHGADRRDAGGADEPERERLRVGRGGGVGQRRALRVREGPATLIAPPIDSCASRPRRVRGRRCRPRSGTRRATRSASRSRRRRARRRPGGRHRSSPRRRPTSPPAPRPSRPRSRAPSPSPCRLRGRRTKRRAPSTASRATRGGRARASSRRRAGRARRSSSCRSGRQVRAARAPNDQPECDRSHRGAGLEARVAVGGLEVLGQPVERTHEREVREADRGGADAEARIAEVGQVQHRLRHAQLPGDEGSDERERDAKPPSVTARASRGSVPR